LFIGQGDAGRLRITGSVQLDARQPQEVKDLAIGVRTLAPAASKVATRESMQYLSDVPLEDGPILIDVEVDAADFEPGTSVQIFLKGFTFQPKPGMFRLSNELQATLQEAKAE
jgi:hypothetical protein